MSVAGVVSTAANDIRMDFMKLLVTQLQNQNPLEPMDNKEMASQLAQLSQLEQLEYMNGTFKDVLAAEQRTQGLALIGKEVTFIPEGATTAVPGRVESMDIYDEGIRLSVGNYTIDLMDVQSVRDGAEAAQLGLSGYFPQLFETED